MKTNLYFLLFIKRGKISKESEKRKVQTQRTFFSYKNKLAISEKSVKNIYFGIALASCTRRRFFKLLTSIYLPYDSAATRAFVFLLIISSRLSRHSEKKDYFYHIFKWAYTRARICVLHS